MKAPGERRLRPGLAAHGIAAAITYFALGFAPAFLSWSTWTLSRILGTDGGVHVYAVGVRGGEQTRDQYAAQGIAPEARLLGLVVLGLYCVASEWSLRRWRAVIVLTPLVPALVGAALAVWATHVAGPPPIAPVLALAVAFLVFFVVSCYWYSLRTVRRILLRASEGTNSRRAS